VWRPVQDYCAQLGERFRFFHFDVMKGFQGRRPQLRAEPDCARRQDHRRHSQATMSVRPDWLKALVPHFDDGRIKLRPGAAGTPRLEGRSLQGDVELGICRLLRNIGSACATNTTPIIQHGNHDLGTRDLMAELDGLGTWCTHRGYELGLRADVSVGYSAMYSRERFGPWLTPDHFRGYKKQRFRWA